MGFRVGCADQGDLQPARRNMKSASENTSVVAKYLEAELAENRIVQVEGELQGLQLSPVSKSGPPGWWRLINDLSSPHGSSVNDAIDSDLCSLKYASLDTAACMVRAVGPGAMMAKLDLRHAYRVVVVHPADRLLLGMCWQGRVFIDTALPFGLHSAPKIFSAVADALLWSMRCRIPSTTWMIFSLWVRRALFSVPVPSTKPWRCVQSWACQWKWRS